MIFLNAIDPQTYQYSDATLIEHDQNSLSFPERISTMYARGQAHDLLSWIFAHHDIVNTKTESGNATIKDPMREIILPHLMYLKKVLCQYKKLADTEKFNIDIPSEALQTQLRLALESFNDYRIAEYQADQSLRAFDCLHWNDCSHLTIVSKTPPKDIPDQCKKPFLSDSGIFDELI